MSSPQLTYYDMGNRVVAFSTTRQGGCSLGNYADFNINGYCGDSEEHIAANKASLAQCLGITAHQIVMPHQVHGREVQNGFIKTLCSVYTSKVFVQNIRIKYTSIWRYSWQVLWK